MHIIQYGLWAVEHNGERVQTNFSAATINAQNNKTNVDETLKSLAFV